MKPYLLLFSLVVCVQAQIVQPNVNLQTGQIYPNNIAVLATNQGPNAIIPISITEMFSYEVPITAFGAVPDDAIDDSPAILLAMAAKGNINIYWPPGLYYVYNTNILITNQYVKWRGAGPSKTILRASNVQAQLPFFIKFFGGPTNAPNGAGYYKDLSDMTIQSDRDQYVNNLAFENISYSVLNNLNLGGGGTALRFTECHDIDVFNLKTSTTVLPTPFVSELFSVSCDFNTSRINFFGGVLQGPWFSCAILDDVSIINFHGTSFIGAKNNKGVRIRGGRDIGFYGCNFVSNVLGDLWLEPSFYTGLHNRGLTSIGSTYSTGIELQAGHAPNFTGGYIANITNAAPVIGANFTSVKYGTMSDLSANTTFLPIVNAVGTPTFKLPPGVGGGGQNNFVTPFYIGWPSDPATRNMLIYSYISDIGDSVFSFIRQNGGVGVLPASLTLDGRGNVGIGYTNVPSNVAKLSISGGVSIGEPWDPGTNNLYVLGDITSKGYLRSTGRINTAGGLAVGNVSYDPGVGNVYASGRIDAVGIIAGDTVNANTVLNGGSLNIINAGSIGKQLNVGQIWCTTNIYADSGLIRSKNSYVQDNLSVAGTISTSVGYVTVDAGGVSLPRTVNPENTLARFDVELVAGTGMLITTNGANKLVLTATNIGGGGGTNITYISNYNNSYYTTNIYNTTTNVSVNNYTSNYVSTNFYVTNFYTTNIANNTYLTTNITQNITTNVMFTNTYTTNLFVTTNTYVTTNVNNTSIFTNIYNSPVKVNSTVVNSPVFTNNPSGVSWGTDGTNIIASLGLLPVMHFAISDETTQTTIGLAKRKMRVPYKFWLISARAYLSSPSTTGVVEVDINRNGVGTIVGSGTTVFTRVIAIENAARTSLTNPLQPVVKPNTILEEDEELIIDIDKTGTGATGLKVILIGIKQ